MKKLLVSAIAALAMVVGGLVAPANATVPASSAGTFAYAHAKESGNLTLQGGVASFPVPAGVTGIELAAVYPASSTLWTNSLVGSARTLTSSQVLTIGGTASTLGTSSAFFQDSMGFSIVSQGNVYTLSGSAGSVKVIHYISLGVGTVTAGNYAWAPDFEVSYAGPGLKTSADFNAPTVTYTFTYAGATTTSAPAAGAGFAPQKAEIRGSVCVNTAEFSLIANDVLTVKVVTNGALGFTPVSQSKYIKSAIGIASSSNGAPLSSSPELANTSTYSYQMTANEVGKLLAIDATYYQPATGASSISMDISVTMSGREVTSPCFPTIAAPTFGTYQGNYLTASFTAPTTSFASIYGYDCLAFATSGLRADQGFAMNNSCTLSQVASGTTVDVFIRAKVGGAGAWIYGAGTVARTTFTASGGAQVTPPGPTVIRNILPVVPVFKQPKFAMPSKIDVDATGKVSLSGKDMGVSTVLIGGKEQKIDTNSDEKLVFDTTGLAKGVHDLVMKGAFGTYTIQKAIQVGEAVVTKVAGVSARQVGMAGGELSISGQGLEGTTQITMNGQVLEIVSRTDSKVTFKVPASTVASVNSIMIEGSFVPVLFKNAFSYTK